MSKNEKQSPDLEKIVASAALGVAIGGVTTYTVMKNSCDNCDCGKEKLNHKQEYKDHKDRGLCDDDTKRCDTCPEDPKNKKCE